MSNTGWKNGNIYFVQLFIPNSTAYKIINLYFILIVTYYWCLHYYVLQQTINTDGDIESLKVKNKNVLLKNM